MRARREEEKEGDKVSLKQVFPFFILFFIGASVITTIATAVGVPETVFVVKLVKSGGRPILLGMSCWLGITLVSLGMQHMMHIW